MKVTLKPTTTVIRPVKDTPQTVLWVSDLDLLVPCTHIQMVYFYRQPNGSSSCNFFNVEVLKQALAKVLVPFYPMAGRLGQDENGRVEVHCNGEGIHFVEAEIDCSMEEFGGFTPREEMVELVPKVDYSGDISSYPLLLVQVTSFKCGGVSLGVAFHHTLCDGTSAIHLINSWSEVARGVPLTTTPFTDRTLLRPRDPPVPTLVHSEYDPPPPMINAVNGPPNATATRILKVSPEQVNALKAASTAGEPNSRPSTYQAVTAHIWRSMSRARGLSNDQPTRLYIATEGRSRLIPPLPKGFFGNVLFTTTVTSLAGEIQSDDLSTTVSRIGSALRRMDGERASSAVDFLATQPDPSALRRGAHTFKCPNLNIVSWITLPLHGADFGWGPPVFMGPAKVIFEGMAYILPSPSGDGGLDVVLCLEVTSFKCGGVSLGVAFHHTLCDGTSAIHLINSWSEVARGVPLTTTPFTDRTLLRPRDPPAPTLVHSEYDPPPPMINAVNAPPNATATRILKVSPEQVNALKAASTAGEPNSRPSTYQAVTAHIWRSMCRARGLSNDQPTRLYIATEGRSRLIPPLPKGFFGNVLFTTTVTSLAGEIQSDDLSTTVNRIGSALRRMDGERASSAVDFLATQPDPSALRRGAHTFKCPNLNIVSWITLPIHGADFGWGPPVFMGPAKVIFEGMAYILPSPSGDGGLDVVLCLDAPHMQIFEKCFNHIRKPKL